MSLRRGSRLPKVQARAPRKDVKAGVVESAPHAEVLQSSGNLQSARKQPERVSQASERERSYLILDRLETERTHRVLASHQIRSGIELWKVLPRGRSVNRLLSIAIVSKGVAQNNLSAVSVIRRGGSVRPRPWGMEDEWMDGRMDSPCLRGFLGRNSPEEGCCSGASRSGACRRESFS